MPEDVATPQSLPTAGGRKRRVLEDVPLTSVRGAIGLVLLAVMAVTLAAVFVQALRGPGAGALTPGLMWANIAFQGLLFAAVPALYVSTVRPRERVADVLRARVTRKTMFDVLKGAGLGVAIIVALAGIVYALQAAGLPREDESILVGEIGTLVRAHPEFLVVAPLAAGLFEETFFRGFLQPRIGLVGSNVVFGLVHLGYGTVLQLVVPALVGLAVGLAFARTRSLWVCIAAHATFDLVQLAALSVAGGTAASIVGFF